MLTESPTPTSTTPVTTLHDEEPFTNVPVCNHILRNVGPDEPFGGGVPGVDFEPADAGSTGQVMEFRVVPAVAANPTTPPQFLVLPALTRLTGARPGGWPCWRRPRSSSRMPRLRHCRAPSRAIRTRKRQPRRRRSRRTPITENPAIGATEAGSTTRHRQRRT